LPAEISPTDQRAVGAWVAQAGADVMGDVSEVHRGLVNLGMKVQAESDDEYWDLLTATDLRRLREGPSLDPGQLLTTSEKENGPALYAFSTRQGALGVLQITGFTENPRGVKIRYKLVQTIHADKPVPAHARFAPVVEVTLPTGQLSPHFLNLAAG